MRRPALLLALILLAGCGPRPEEHTRLVERSEVRSGGRYVLRSRLKPGRGTLGDVIQWELTAEVPRRALIGNLIEERPDSTLDRAALGHPRLEAGRSRDLWRWSRRIQGFALGPIPLPRTALVVDRPTISDTLFFPPDTLFVDSLTAAPRDSIDPDRGAISPGLRPVDRVVAAAGVALLVALVAGLLWAGRRLLSRRAELPAGAPPEPPSRRFARVLDALRKDVDRLSRDAFYDRLSGAVRSYLEAETGIQAPERTTREVEEELLRMGRGDGEVRASVGRLLRRADLAKFARAEDERAAALEAIEEARSLAGRLSPPSPGPPQDDRRPPGGRSLSGRT